jgi:pSer/pThr/pTyr-binding forkhead associated (FHA) protein
VSGKVVLVNGSQVKEEVPLTHKMRLQLGGDELLFLDEGGATAVAEVPPGATAFAGRRLLRYVIGALVLAGALWLWVGR